MASAIDSGVDTGNDSNDSSFHDMLSKMELDSSHMNVSDPAKETLREETQDEQSQPHSSSSLQEEYSSSKMLTHLQPASLMHGYEYHPPSDSHSVNFKCFLDNMKMRTSNLNDMRGVPFGTDYLGKELVIRMHNFRRTSICDKRRVLLNKSSRTVDYARLRDTKRMCRAACHNNTEAVREMLEAGISPNCHDGYKRSPLHLAACMGYADMVKLLLDHGADPNAKDSIGNTPLHLAACTNHVSVITLLLKAGTRVTERDLAGHSPLQLAITKFNIMKRSTMPHPVLKEQVCQVVTMLIEYMKRSSKERPTIDPDLLNRFESLVRVSDSTEEVESNIQDLLSNLSLSSSS